MSRCPYCEVKTERACSYGGRTREYYSALMPALQHVAYRYGYALAVHGSLKTDIDLIACPWRGSCLRASSLAEAIRKTAEQIIGHAEMRKQDPSPTQKPCGRLAWSFYLQPEGCEGPYIDLSVMPVLRDDVDALKEENLRLKKALEHLRDCDWTITLPNRMDAVREIARKALGGEQKQ